MKPFRFVAAVLFVTSTAARAQTEGTADFKGTVHTDKNQTIPSQGKVFLSKGAVRVEWQTDLRSVAADRKETGKPSAMPETFRMVMIQRAAEPDRIYVVNDERKTYAVQMIDEKREHPTPERSWKVRKLGRDTVAGFSCEKAILTAQDGDQTEVCVTAELVPSTAWLKAWNRREEQSSPLKALKQSGIEGFPVRWIFRSGSGKEITSSIELVRFDKKSLSASVFEIPAGYRKVDSMGETLAASPEQEKALREARKRMQEALDRMTPEQRKKYEEMLRQQQPPPQP